MSQIIEKTDSAIRQTVENLGYELVEIEYKKQFDQMNLTIFIDNDSGISLDDCEKVHHAIDPLLDEADPTSGAAYILNVSSCGLDRPLKLKRDFEKNLDKEIDISLFAPINKKKKLTGFLTAYDDESVTVEVNGEELIIERSKIAIMKPAIRF